MKFHTAYIVALTTYGLLTSAGVLHIDVETEGDVTVNIDTNNQHVEKPEQPTKRYPKRPARKRTDWGTRASPSPPVALEEYDVDLWYETHRGFLSDDNKYINFSNIPYAEPPIGERRWQPPEYVYTEEPRLNTGNHTRICPQKQVGWAKPVKPFLENYVFPKDKDFNQWKNPIGKDQYGESEAPPSHYNITEDCLYLDVFVPKQVWEYRKSPIKAAVIVFIHGGGFVYGWKEQFGSPEGLIAASAKDEYDHVIYVSLNYRLGAFGFLGGEKLLDDWGYPNVGLHDQRFALDWVKRYITQFGGDPKRVTVMGQSAGAASILHQITWAGYTTDPLFRRAIIQSPGFFPQPTTVEADATYLKFLNRTGATNLEGLWNVSESTLIKANAELTYESEYGLFNFGPTIDHVYITDLPSTILRDSDYYNKIPILLGHTSLDGLLFTPPWIRDNAALGGYIQRLYPNLTSASLDKIKELYPITGPSEKEKITQVSDLLDDIAIQCNNYYLTEAFVKSKNVYRYIFNAPPLAIHGADVRYTYYPTKAPYPALVNKDLAETMQRYFVNFARYEDPNEYEKADWPKYNNDNHTVIHFGSPDGKTYKVVLGSDPIFDAATRGAEKCKFWESNPYNPPKKSPKLMLNDQTRPLPKPDL